MFAKIENGNIRSITIGDIPLGENEVLLPDNIDIDDICFFSQNGFFEKEKPKNCIDISNPDKRFDLLEIK
jgi:hypothetical protein